MSATNDRDRDDRDAREGGGTGSVALDRLLVEATDAVLTAERADRAASIGQPVVVLLLRTERDAVGVPGIRHPTLHRGRALAGCVVDAWLRVAAAEAAILAFLSSPSSEARAVTDPANLVEVLRLVSSRGVDHAVRRVRDAVDAERAATDAERAWEASPHAC